MSYNNQAILQEIREVFSDAANPREAALMTAYMKGIAPYFGIKTTPRRLMQREFFSVYKDFEEGDFTALCKLLFAQAEREFHYVAMEWLYHRRKTFTPQTIGLIDFMLRTKSWWETIDFLSTRVLAYWAEKFPHDAKPVIKRYIASDNFWLNRCAIIHQLHFGKNFDTKLLTDSILPHTGSKEFFVQKAIGWSLRYYARRNPGWVRAFVATHPLPALSRREAMKHL